MSAIDRYVRQPTCQAVRIIACDTERDLAYEYPKQLFQDRLELAGCSILPATFQEASNIEQMQLFVISYVSESWRNVP